jgi:aspartyl-tRNA(Asn)/glutamyl-tRNA(Gln) amidotransferase subunit B
LIEDGTISGKIAKDVLREIYRTGKDARDVVREKGLVQITNSAEIEAVVEKVLAENAESVAKYKSGQISTKGYLVGQVIKSMGGRANPAIVQGLVGEALEKS